MIPGVAGPRAYLGNHTIDYHIVAVGVNPHRTDGRLCPRSRVLVHPVLHVGRVPHLNPAFFIYGGTNLIVAKSSWPPSVTTGGHTYRRRRGGQ